MYSRALGPSVRALCAWTTKQPCLQMSVKGFGCQRAFSCLNITSPMTKTSFVLARKSPARLLSTTIEQTEEVSQGWIVGVLGVIIGANVLAIWCEMNNADDSLLQGVASLRDPKTGDEFFADQELSFLNIPAEILQDPRTRTLGARSAIDSMFS